MGKIKIVVRVALVVVMAFVLLAASCAAPTPTAKPEAEPIKVGLELPLSGWAAAWGLSKLYCAEIWAEDVNRQGGILVDGVKRKVELFPEDDKGSPAPARAAVEKLVYQDKVDVIAGVVLTNIYQAIAPILLKEEVFTLAVNWYKDAIGPHAPYIFRVIPTHREVAPLAFKWFKEEKGVENAYVVYPNYEGGILIKDEEIGYLEKLGYEVLGEASYETTAVDFMPVATKVAAAKPDFIITGSSSSSTVGMLCKALYELGWRGIVWQSGQGDPASTIAAGSKESAQMLYFNGGGSDVGTAKMEEFKKHFTDKAGKWNEAASQDMYIFYVLGAAIEAAGTLDKAKLATAMEDLQWPNPFIEGNPPIYFGNEAVYGIGHNIYSSICIMKIEGDTGKTLEILQR